MEQVLKMDEIEYEQSELDTGLEGDDWLHQPEVYEEGTGSDPALDYQPQLKIDGTRPPALSD